MGNAQGRVPSSQNKKLDFRRLVGILLLWSGGFNAEAGRVNLKGTLFCLPRPGLECLFDYFSSKGSL